MDPGCLGLGGGGGGGGGVDIIIRNGLSAQKGS